MFRLSVTGEVTVDLRTTFNAVDAERTEALSPRTVEKYEHLVYRLADLRLVSALRMEISQS